MADYAQTDDGNPREVSGKYWREQLDHSEKLMEKWEERGDKVVDRYRDERLRKVRKYNILWANTQVLSPSLYGRAAKPEVSRRYMDSDPVGRLASTILERVLEYEVDQFPDFHASMLSCVEDRLLPGRGTAWIRFAPIGESGNPIVAAKEDGEEGQISNTTEEPELVDAAHSPVDYVFWKDFRHSPARTWDEVWWVSRRVYMTTDEGVTRFGAEFKNVPLSAKQTDDASNKTKFKHESSFEKKAEVWEIWNKRTGRVCWIATGYALTLDEREDPLHLEGFFPSPMPLFATTTNGSLIPIPDYCEYQDQAEALDEITNRISRLVKAIKAVGCFNSEFKELGRLFTEGIDNTLIPVTNWQALSEKNGLKGAVDLLDISVQIQALAVLYKAAEDIKQTIYEICGISDILRGSSDAQETLGAQQLKANFGSLRLRRSQTDVARFASDLFRLKAQVICQFYPPELIVQMSGVMRSSEVQDPAFGQVLPQALQLLQNSTIRDFSIQVESDTLAQIDEQEEKQAASEAITAIGGFVKEAMPMVGQAPETLPMVSEMLLFLVRRFRAGRGLESAIERTMMALQQKAAQMAQNPPPDPEEKKVQAQMQADQMRVQADTQSAQMKAGFDREVQQGKLQQEMQLEQAKSQQAAALAKMDGEYKLLMAKLADETERWKAQLDADTKLRIAGMQQQTAITTKKAEIMAGDAESTKKIDADHQARRIEKGPPANHEMKLQVSTAKTRKKVVRDNMGRVTEILVIPEEESETPGTDPAIKVNVGSETARLVVERDTDGRITEVREE